jgi:hypothetical protein
MAVLLGKLAVLPQLIPPLDGGRPRADLLLSLEIGISVLALRLVAERTVLPAFRRALDLVLLQTAWAAQLSRSLTTPSLPLSAVFSLFGRGLSPCLATVVASPSAHRLAWGLGPMPPHTADPAGVAEHWRVLHV